MSNYSKVTGTVSLDFLLLVLFMDQFPPRPSVFHEDLLPPVSLIPVANLPPVSLIPVANLPPVSIDTGGKFATGGAP